MKETIGFIGGGNMGSAMIKGILSSNLCTPEQIMVADRSFVTLNNLEKEHKITTTQDNELVASKSDILFLAVKPFLYETVIKEIRDVVREETLVISIAAGLKIKQILQYFGRSIKLIRVMPNTPAMVLEAMSAISPGSLVTEEELSLVTTLFESFGKAEVIAESMMDTVTGVSGSSPAYVYLFIESMADAAVADGMPRDMAYKFAAQSVLGAAKMVLETGIHPGELKDAVCSPGGTTIEAVSILEKEGLRNAVISAQRKCVKKSKELGRTSR